MKRRIVTVFALLAALALLLSFGSVASAAESTRVYLDVNFENMTYHSVEYTFFHGVDGSFQLVDGKDGKALSFTDLLGTSAAACVFGGNTEYTLSLEVKPAAGTESFTVLVTDLQSNVYSTAVVTFGNTVSVSEENVTATAEATSQGYYRVTAVFTTGAQPAQIKLKASSAIIDNILVTAPTEASTYTYSPVQSDGFEGNASTLATSNMLSNPQTGIWNADTTLTDDPRVIAGENSLMLDMTSVNTEADRWRTALRFDPLKTNMVNGFYRVQFDVRSRGVLTFHAQVKTLEGDVVIGEYYVCAQTLADADTGNSLPCLGYATRKGDIVTLTLEFAAAKKVYIDVTAQLDYTAEERYYIVDNAKISGLELEQYPSYTYKDMFSEVYTDGEAGIWTKGDGASNCSVSENGVEATVRANGKAILASGEMALEAKPYKLFIKMGMKNILNLDIVVKKDGEEVYRFGYDVPALSISLSLQKITNDISCNQRTGVYTVSGCFTPTEAGRYTVEYYATKYNEFAKTTITLKSFEILQQYDNAFVGKDVPVGDAEEAEDHVTLGGIGSVINGGSAGGCNGSVAAVGVLALVCVMAAAKKRG